LLVIPLSGDEVDPSDEAIPPVEDIPPPPGPPLDPGTGTGPDVVPVVLEAAFPEIRRLKAIGSALFVGAGLSAIAPALLEGEVTSSPSFLSLVVLACAGIAISLAGLFTSVTRRIAAWMGPALLVASAAVNPLGANLGDIPPTDMVFAFTFAITWLLAVEHLHAIMRFVELGGYITRQRLTSFRLSSVVNHFQLYGAGMAGLIIVVTAIVVVGIPWVLEKGGNQVFGRSVELGSVFGIAIAAAIVFTLAGMILVFIRSVLPQRVDVEQVAYSRDRMEDMIRGSQVMETQEGDQGLT
jgi:hypothetical protein